MSGRLLELVLVPLGAMRRASIVWGVAFALFIGVTVAFWPAFSGSSAVSQAFDQMPAGLVQALGMQDIGTPAGFLRANLYEVLIPLLLIVAAAALANGQSASEEDAGRLELLLAQPVSRTALWAGRVVALLVALAIIGAVMLVAQLVFDAVIGLQISAAKVLATVVLCSLLGLLFGCLTLAIAGFAPRPSLALGLTVALGVAAYLVVALFPLNADLAAWRHASPWDWALGGDPLVKATDAWRYVALAVPSLILAAIGALGFARRDILSA